MRLVDVRPTKSTLVSCREIGVPSRRAELLLRFVWAGPSVLRALRDGRIHPLQYRSKINISNKIYIKIDINLDKCINY